MNFYIIAAKDEKNGIGKNGKLPWNLPGDLANFNKITRGNGKNAVIMGRTTWEALPNQHRPLKGRINIVLSKNEKMNLPLGVEKADSLDHALGIAASRKAERVFVIGGAQIYSQVINHSNCAGIYITEVAGDFHCDAFFPEIDEKKFKLLRESEPREENGIKFRFTEYVSYTLVTRKH